MVGSSGNQFPSLGVFPESHKPSSGGKTLAMNTRHSFHLYGSRVFQKLRKVTKYYSERCSHYSYHLGNSKGLGGSEPGTLAEEEIYMKKKYFGHLNEQMYISHKSQYHKLIKSIYHRNTCQTLQRIDKDAITIVSPGVRLAVQCITGCFPEMVHGWSGHPRQLLSCSLYILCLTCACFTFTLLSWLTFQGTCPWPQLVITCQRSSEGCAPLLVSLVTNEQSWGPSPFKGAISPTHQEWSLPPCPAQCS